MSSGCLALDWNGTVVADTDRAREATVLACPETGARFADIAAFRREFRLPMADFFRHCGVALSDVDDAVDRWNHAMARLPAPLAPGARDLLDFATAGDIPGYVVSGAAADMVAADCAAHGLDRYRLQVRGAVHPKRVAIDELRERHGRVVYVGDTDYDIREGLAAGAYTVGTRYGYHDPDRLTAAGAQALVSSLAEIPALWTVT